ncbi:MAG TPA: DUF58 domain-containing protein, partial [Pirellulales bacterium]|nr:DUF58 domain-containing protein [Pirellulales bacterium]
MKKPRYKTLLTFEGCCYLVIAGFILAGAMARQINLLMVLFGLLAGAFLVHWRLVRKTVRKLDIERRLPTSVSAGDLLVVELAAVNRRRRLGAWAVAVSDLIRREGQAKRNRPVQGRAMFTYVPPRDHRTTTYRGRLFQRGKYRFGPLEVTSRFPLGLLRYRATFDAVETLLVFPRLGHLSSAWRRWHEGLESGGGQSSRRRGLMEGEFYGLRDWRSGDSRRWLHWRTSARRQTPVVRQFEQPRDLGLAIVLDLWQPEAHTTGGEDAVEIAVSFVATVVTDLCRAGGRRLAVGGADDDPWLVEGAASAALLEEVMCRLATIEAASKDRLPETLSQLLERVRRRTQLLVVSTRPVDLEHDSRFASLRDDGRLTRWLSKLKTVDTSS